MVHTSGLMAVTKAKKGTADKNEEREEEKGEEEVTRFVGGRYAKNLKLRAGRRKEG